MSKFLGGWTCFHFSWGSDYRSGSTGACGNSVFTFLTDSQTVLSSSFLIFHLTQHLQCKCSALSMSSPTLTVFLVTVFLAGVKWHLTEVSVCISLMNDLFTCSLAIYISLEKSVCGTFTHFVFLLSSPHFLRGQKRDRGRNFSGNRRDLD